MFDWRDQKITKQSRRSCKHYLYRHAVYCCTDRFTEYILSTGVYTLQWQYQPLLGIHHSVGATVYPTKYAHGFVVLCFVVVMQSFIMYSREVFIHIHQGCFAGTGAIVRLPQCQWSKPDGYGKISQCITTTKHSKAKTVCIFLGIYCNPIFWLIDFWIGINVDHIFSASSFRPTIWYRNNHL